MVASLVGIRGPTGMEANMDLKGFAARLKQLRESRGLSQKALAEKAGLSQRAISAWEQAEREPGWLAVVARGRALGVDCHAFDEDLESIREPKRGRPPHKPEVEPPDQGAGGKASTEDKPKEPRGKKK